MTSYAHSRNSAGKRHELARHLLDVAEQSHAFADSFGLGELAYWAGLCHDLGKYHQDFQEYLLACEANPKAIRRGPDHKRTGSAYLAKRLPPLAMLIKGHHGGLPAKEGLQAWIDDRAFTAAVAASLNAARADLDSRLDIPGALRWPDWAKDVKEAELLLRMIFSALVDADCLDTERHFNPNSSSSRGDSPSLSELWSEFAADQEEQFSNVELTAVNRVRREVYDACLAAANEPPGFFRLTVPTGGGKTRSVLAFALRHALKHDLARVIVAIPYTSIIEQTAQVYRRIFSSPRAVLEHHSAVDFGDGADEAPVAADTAWARLAAENWDAPIVVTTNVQLFESLLGQRTGRCRKLHNVARAVIVLDEAQNLPPHLLESTLDVLRSLVAYYGVSVVLCTATQPALDDAPGFRGLPNVREIVPDPRRHFLALERVAYEWVASSEKWSWTRVAEELRGDANDQALAIVNTKNDALALLDALDGLPALHLSTLLCAAHRQKVLSSIKRRLTDGEPCLVVATQVVEAGVDLDFPLVLRALGPLDRIVQAAGRCNREGKLVGKGRMIVFQPEEGGLPPGVYRIASDATRILLRADEGVNVNEPELYKRFFQYFYSGVDLDAKRVGESRRALDYPEVAARYRLVEDDGLPVVVRHEDGEDDVAAEALVRELQAHPEQSRSILRRLQPYIVNVRSAQLGRFAADGLAREVMPGLWEWCGKYDEVRGLGAGEPDLVRLVVAD